MVHGPHRFRLVSRPRVWCNEPWRSLGLSVALSEVRSVCLLPYLSVASACSASLPPYYLYVYCIYVGDVVAYGSLSPSVTLYCLHQSLLLSTLIYLQYIHVHLQYRSTRSTSVLITFTSQHANPHRPQLPIIAYSHHLILS